jgi:glutaredoxin-related protein
MQRQILEEARLHPSIRDKIANYRIATVETVRAAVEAHDVVVVGMSQNPFPKRARQLLDRKGIAYHYIEYGSYFSKWHERLPLKLWTGWPTFPMIFVKGSLIGGFQDLERLIENGEFDVLRAAPRNP